MQIISFLLQAVGFGFIKPLKKIVPEYVNQFVLQPTLAVATNGRTGNDQMQKMPNFLKRHFVLSSSCCAPRTAATLLLYASPLAS